MKKLVLFTAILIMVFSVSAQKFPENFIKFKQKFKTGHQQLNKRDGMLKLDSMVMSVNDGEDFQTYLISHFDYNGQGSLQEVVELYYDFEFGTIEYDYKTVYRYDVTGYNVIAEIDYEWLNARGEWTISDSTYYTYNDGLMVQEDYYWWDELNQEWDHDYISMYYYNDDDLVDSIIGTVWNGTDYDNSYKEVYLYANGKFAQYDTYNWETGSWIQDERYTYTWDGEKLSEILIQLNSTGVKELVNSEKYTYTWQTNGNLNEEIDYEWDTDLLDWVESAKLDGTYDNMYTYEDLVLPFAFEGEESGNPDMFFAHKVDTVFFYDPIVTKEWTKTMRMNFYYSNYVGLNNTIDDYGKVKVYPNPVSTELNIENEGTAQIFILDVSGKVLSDKMIQEKGRFNVSNLNAGIYFVKIITPSGKVLVSKFIKE
jgi:hypothetical protein